MKDDVLTPPVAKSQAPTSYRIGSFTEVESRAECGRELRRFTLAGLLQHVEKHAVNQEHLAAANREAKTNHLGHSRVVHQQRMEETAEKWRAWATLLRDLLDRKQVGDDIPIAEIPGFRDLSVRTRKSFARQDRIDGRTTFKSKLLAMTADDLLSRRNFGLACLAEVRKWLASNGMRLTGDPVPSP